MPISTYRNVDALVAHIHGQSASITAAAAAPPPESSISFINDIHMVGRPGRERPMVFVQKTNKESGNTVVALKRLDWKSMSRFSRFCARVRALLRLEPPRKRYLNAREITALRLADGARAPENALMSRLSDFFAIRHDRANAAPAKADMPVARESPPAFSASALSAWSSVGVDHAPDDCHRDRRNEDTAPIRERTSAAPKSGPRKPSPQERADAIVLAFAPLVAALRENLGQLGNQPMAVALRAEQRMLAQMRSRVEAQCDRFALDDEQKTAVIRRLRVNTVSWASATDVAPGTDVPVVPLLTGRLARMECTTNDIPVGKAPTGGKAAAALATIPVRDPALAAKGEVVLGDMHGDWVLLLHALTQTGFIHSQNEVAWQAMWARLQAIAHSDNGMTDKEWPTLLNMISQAVAVHDSARSGRRLTFTGNLVGPPDAAARMLDVMQTLSRLGLKFECLLGEQEYQLVENAYSLPLQSPSATSSRWLFTHLKLLSCSRDGTTLYTHHLISPDTLADIAMKAGVPSLRELNRDVGTINGWLQAVLAGENREASAQSDALRLLGKLVANEGAGPNSATSPALPHPAVRYVVHAGRGNVCKEVTAQHDRMEGLRTDMEKVHALFEPAAMGRRPWNPAALPPLASILARLDRDSLPQEIAMAGHLLALAMCHEAALLKHKESGILAQLTLSRDADQWQRSEALALLARMWNGTCQDESSEMQFDIGKLTEEQRNALFDTVSTSWRAVRDKRALPDRLRELALEVTGQTDQWRDTIRRLAAPPRPGTPETLTGRPAALAGAVNAQAAHKTYVPALSRQELRNYLVPISTRFHSVHNPGPKPGPLNVTLTIHAID